MMHLFSPHRVLTAAMVVAAATTIGLPTAVVAQNSGHRLSLADRVSRLEQQQSQGSIKTVNRVQQLQSQVQQLLGKVQELQHQLEQFQQVSKDRYVDLDSRLRRLESGQPTAAASEPAADAGQGASGSSASMDNASAGVGPSGSSGDAAATTSPEAAYERAFSALRNGDFAAASRLFQAFISQHPNTELTPNAYYWLGESYYGVQNYPVALQTFQQLLRRFPDDAKAPGALLKVGYSQFELQRWDQARATLQKVRQKYPDSREARLAAGRLRALERKAGA